MRTRSGLLRLLGLLGTLGFGRVAVSGSHWQWVAVSGSHWQWVAVSGSHWQWVAVSGSRRGMYAARTQAVELMYAP